MKTYRMLAVAGFSLSLWFYISGCTIVARPAPPPPPPMVVQPQPPLTANVEAPPPPMVVQPQPPVMVNVEPPPMRKEVVVVAPSPHHVWVPGYWVWNGRWVWQPGHWAMPPRPHAKWVAGHWKRQPGGWVWVAGQWR